MNRARLLGRAAIPDTGPGQKAYAYYLRRGASALVPEVADVAKSNSIFGGFSKNPWHTLATSAFGATFEAHAAALSDVVVLERIRDRQFVASVEGRSRLIPDATLLVAIGGKRKLLFIEIVNETSVINPGAAHARGHSFSGTVEKYKAFCKQRASHPMWSALEKVYGPISGFQVLVVTTRDNCPWLLGAAEGSRSMFLIAKLSELRGTKNLFTEPVWWLPRSAWRKAGPERTALIGH